MIVSNCVEYGWQTDGTYVPSGSWYASPQKRLYFPETASRQFSSVAMMYHGRNAGNEAVTIQNLVTMSIQIDTSPSQSYIINDGFRNQTLEQISYFTFFDVTDYFNTYYTSSNHLVRIGFRDNGTNIICKSFKILATYQFDDSQTNTSVKTVRLPITSISTTALITTPMYLGNHTGSIPALDTYLPELEKTYRDIFIEYHSNDANTSTSNYQLFSRIDLNPSSSRFTASGSLQSAPQFYDIETLSGSIDTSTTHSIRLSSTVANRFTSPGAIFYCTYEYDYTGSSTVLNSVVTTMFDASMHISEKDMNYFNKRIYLPETGVRLANSGWFIIQTGPQPRYVSLNTVSSSAAIFAFAAGSIQVGLTPLIVQIDGTGSSISRISLNDGWNNIPCYVGLEHVVSSNGNILTGGLLYLNYYCSSSLSSPCRNSKTVSKLSRSTTVYAGSSISPFYHIEYQSSSSIDESMWYIQDIANVFYYAWPAAANTPIYNILECVVFATGSDANYLQNSNRIRLLAAGYVNDSRYMHTIYVGDLTENVMPHNRYYSNRNSNRIDIRAVHKYGHRTVILSPGTAQAGATHIQYLTYHSNIFSVTGSIQNYSGSGIIPLTVYDYDTGEKLFVTQSKSGGVIDTYWYDRHSNLMIVAETGSRYVSNVLPAGSGSFSITIPTAGSPAASEHSFTFIS